MQEDAECPLCLEEMDISDLNFKPCPCGYQVRASAGPSSLELPSLTRGAALCRSASSAGTTSRRTSTADALRAGGSTLMRQSSSSRSTQRSECLVVCLCHSMSASYTPGELYSLCVLVDLSLASARKAHAQRDVSRSPKVSAFVSIVAWP